MIRTTKSFKGILVLNDKNEYILNKENLSECLNRIYMSNVNNFIDIQIQVKDRAKKISEYGELYLQQALCGIFDYFVNDFALGLYLYNHTGEEMTINIKYTKEETES